MNNRLLISATTVWLGLTLAARSATADGGAVVLGERAGDYRVTVLAAPAVLRVGPCDLSVLVQRAESDEPVEGATVTLTLKPADEPESVGLRLAATRAAATNKLFYAAQFDLPASGAWTLGVTVDGEQSGSATVNGRLDVAGPAPKWVELWPWIVWPAGVVLVYVLREQGRGRKSGFRH
jgi:hypothetical protein